jgi:CBS domain containing-hemolysin-like protein
MALQRSDQTAMAVAFPMEVVRWVFGPAIALLNGASGLVLRLAGLQPATEEERVHSVEELKYLVTASRHAGVLDEIEGEMVDRVFDFGETRTYEVMLPRTQMVAVEADTSLDAALDLMVAEGHTRVPAYEGDLDNVVGIVHLHDLLRAQRQGSGDALTVRNVMRPPLVVPESASVEAILGQMRRYRTQMAIVLDEHGGTAGLVTMEDLVEEIVGEVQDELEHPHEAIRPQPDGTVLVDGLVTVDEFGERFDVAVPDEDYNTVGGLVMARLGKVPSVGDVVQGDGYDLRVEAMDHLRVATVRLSKR